MAAGFAALEFLSPLADFSPVKLCFVVVFFDDAAVEADAGVVDALDAAAYFDSSWSAVLVSVPRALFLLEPLPIVGIFGILISFALLRKAIS